MKGTHLSLEDRKKIQEGIENELTKVEIAKSIGKDPTTVSKEIKKRRKLKPRNLFNNPIACTNLKNVVDAMANVLSTKKLVAQREIEK